MGRVRRWEGQYRQVRDRERYTKDATREQHTGRVSKGGQDSRRVVVLRPTHVWFVQSTTQNICTFSTQ